MRYLSIIFLLLPLFAFPQFNYHKMSVSLGGGVTVPHTDITDFSSQPVINGAVHYNITPYVAVGIDAEVGKLDGNYHNMYEFENKFMALAADARLQMRQFTGEEVSGLPAAFSRLYLGAGLGMVRSNATASALGGGDDRWFGPDGESGRSEYKSADIIVPVFAGVNIPIMESLDREMLSLFVNYRLNVSFSDELDAVASSGSTADDHFSTLSIGVRFNFGASEPYFPRGY